jgi:hypothetical protein
MTQNLKRQPRERTSALPTAPGDQPKSAGVEPPVVRSAEARRLIPCGKTKLFDLIAAGEVDSYLDGGVRMIVTASIHARRRRLQESAAGTGNKIREMTMRRRSIRARGRRKLQERQTTA